MHDSSRLWATFIIWGALTAMLGIIAGTLIVTHAEIDFGGGVLLLIIIATLAETAARGTKAVWKSSLHQAETSADRLAKAKRTRRDRIERLVDSLADDEVYDLEALLLAQHEEQRGRL